MPGGAPSVFISYSHRPEGDRDSVAGLVRELQEAGIAIAFDLDQPPTETDFPKWSEARLKRADKTLIVCNREYAEAYHSATPKASGKGVRWEGHIIRQQLYDAHNPNLRFAIVLLRGSDAEHLPDAFRGLRRFQADQSEGLNQLEQWLRQPPIELAPPPAHRAARGRRPAGLPEPEAAAVLLLDVVNFTPLATQLDASKIHALAESFRAQVLRCAEGLDLTIIKGLGDAYLMHATRPATLPQFFSCVFGRNGIHRLDGHPIELRIAADFGPVVLPREAGRIVDAHGVPVIRIFRLEKLAGAGQVICTPSLVEWFNSRLAELKIIRQDELMPQLKGFERSPDPDAPEENVKVVRLFPPVERPDSSQPTADRFAVSQAALFADVQEIRLLGNLFAPIPMQDSFIELECTAASEPAAAGFRIVPLDHRRRMEPSRLGSPSRRVADREREPAEEHSPAHSLTVAQLYDGLACAVILGLPGSGKTTILRRLAFLHFSADARHVVVFASCRNFRAEHFASGPGGTPRAPADLAAALRLLVADAMFEDKTLPLWQRPPEQQTQLTAAAQLVTEAWRADRALILLDALDEAPPGDVRSFLRTAFRRFSDDLAQRAQSRQPGARTSRALITARLSEQRELGQLRLGQFDVNPLRFSDLQQFGQRLLAGDPALADAFISKVAHDPVAQRIGGTPLTATLLIYNFQASEGFDLRFASYDLFCRFVLLDVWERVKKGEDQNDPEYFPRLLQAAAKSAVITDPEVALRYEALARLCYDCLYDPEASSGGADADLNELTLTASFADYLGSTRLRLVSAQASADEWIREMRAAHLLISAGSGRYHFIHRTVMEFLAARHLVLQGTEEQWRKALACDLRRPECEALPIAAGHQVPAPGAVPGDPPSWPEAGYGLLARLHRNHPGSFPESTLALRILAEIEAAEARHYSEVSIASVRANRAAVFDHPLQSRQWLYDQLARFLLEAPARRLLEMREAYRDKLPLAREHLLQRHFEQWADDGSERARAFADLLDTLVHPEPLARWRSRLRQRTADRTLQRDGTVSLLTLDLPGDPNDKNFTYFRDRAMAVSVRDGPLRLGVGLALRGFLGSPNLRAGGAIRCLAVAPDGQTFITGSDDGILRMWEAANGRELRTLSGHRGTVYACAFSPDGKTVLSGSMDGTLKLWGALDGRELRTFIGHRGTVYACAFNPDGKSVLSGSLDHTLRFWEVATGRELRTLTGHRAAVTACAFSQDGQTVLSASMDDRLKLWEAANGRELRTLSGHRGTVYACAFSPDGKTVLSGSVDGTLKLWEAAGGRELRTLSGHRGTVYACAFSPDGKTVLSGSFDDTLKLWEASSGRELRAFIGHKDSVYACAFSPDGQLALSGSEDKTLKLWKVASGRERQSFTGHKDSAIACAYSPDGKTVLSGSKDVTLKFWEVSSGRELRMFTGHKAEVAACVFSPDGKTILSASTDSSMKLWEVSSGRELRAFIGHKDTVNACAFSPDGKAVLSGSVDATLKLWQATSGRELQAFTGHRSIVYACAFSLSGKTVLSGSGDKTLKLWEAATGRELQAFTGHEDAVCACAFSPDGKTVLSGSGDHTLKLWVAASGRELQAFTGHKDTVYACAFSPDGKTVLSGSGDKTLKLWEAASGRLLFTWRVGWPIQGLSWSHVTPHWVAVAGANGTVTLWDLDVAK